MATEEISRYAIETNLDVLLIQEPYTYKDRVFGLGTGVKIVQAERGTPWAALAVFRRDCTVTQLGHITTTQLAALHIQASGISVNLVSLYCKATKESKTDMRRAHRELTLALDQLNKDGVIIGADTNARSRLWYPDRLDERGQKMEQLIALHALSIMNEKQEHPTYEGPCGSSNIDVTLTRGCRNAVVRGWRVGSGASQSDHDLITFEIRPCGSRWADPPPRLQRYRIDTSKFRLLRTSVKKRLAVTPQAHETQTICWVTQTSS